MTVEEIHNRINQLCEERGWSAYRLAKESGIPYSTYYNTLSRNTIPKLETIEKICDGFGITLSQFFCMTEDIVELSQEQKIILERVKCYDNQKKQSLFAYMDAIEKIMN